MRRERRRRERVDRLVRSREREIEEARGVRGGRCDVTMSGVLDAPAVAMPQSDRVGKYSC